MIPRWIHQFYAELRGYWWKACPSCDRFFGGHEVQEIRGHRASRPAGDFEKEDICPQCTAAGVGCVAWALEGQHHECCPFAPIELRETQ